jgi:PAT family beta-lactamase induction signal transducer AmpG
MSEPVRSMRVGWLVTFATIFYFSEGFPFGIVNELMPLYLRSEGVSLTQIGLLSTVGLIWTLKLFWAPAVDGIATYPRWIAGALAAITVALVLLAAAPAPATPLFWTLVVIIVIGSATQDIAVDAYTIAATPSKWLGIVNSIRVTAYRAALIAAAAGLAWLGQWTGWRTAFLVAAATAGAFFVASFFLPPTTRPPATAGSAIAGLRRWLARPGALLLLLIVFLYRLSDSSLNQMIRPFWVDNHYSPAEIATVNTAIGISFTIIGAWLGGLAIVRWGIYRSLLWLGLLQILSNFGYALIASFGGGRSAFYSAAIIESITYGLGTGAFLAFLMAICEKTRAATEYALLSAIFGLSRSIAGTVSGAASDAMGYAPWFWITAALGIPGLAIVVLAREHIEASEATPPAAVEVM